jgi:putative Ca2+/H+ antiporter (TMEM165/GDT1 family)
VIFIGELPDKTMFASLVLSSRGKPRSVWMGAAAAFLLHVVIAVTIGVGLFHLFPHRVVEAVVAALFLLGSFLAYRESRAGDEDEPLDPEPGGDRKVITTAFLVIFVAEWGDLTQILTANLAAHYHSPLSVGIGAVLALWAVAAIAVIGGQTLLRYLKVSTLRIITAVVLLVLAVIAAISAIK